MLDPPLFWKLTVPMVLVVGLSTLGSLTSLRTAQRSEGVFERLYRDRLLDDRAIARVSALQLRHYLTLTRLVTLTERRAVAPAVARAAHTLARVEAARQDAARQLLLRLRERRGAADAPGRPSAQQVAQKYGQYTASARAVLACLRRGEQAGALALTNQGLRPLMADLSELTAKLKVHQERSSHLLLARAKALQRSNRWLTLALHAAGAVFALLVSLLVARVLTARMRLLVACAGALGQGELGARAKLNTRDEFGALARRLNAMARRLSRLFREIDHQHSALRESEARLQAILDYSTAAISLKDRQGRYLLVNQRYADLTGLAGSALVGLTDDAFFPPEIAGALAAHDRAVIEGGEPLTVEEVFSHAEGAPIFLVLKFALQDAQGEPYALCSMASDITARKEVERLKSEFVSVVSHELRTPLTAIRGALGLLEGGVVGTLPPKARELAALARQNSERLVRLINDILDLEKLAAGKVELHLRPLTIAEVIKRTVDELTPLADSAGIVVDTGAVDAALELSADRDRLIQVLTNLLGNAIKFSPEGTTITIGARGVNQHRLRVSVTDQGAGISAEQQQLLFTRFQQLDGSDARKKGGTGLGLAIARAIVEQHGGRIGVESAPGRGSTFFFELPREQQVYEI
ncbi:MAG: PAS domain-containing protein [Proteobacteria bacterium]|nr:PAS domain-containing protein [Pseudomonadota bacterium]